MKCFYHNDIDGKCAGALVARFTNNYNKEDFIECDYKNPFPIDGVDEGEEVYFVDLSFSGDNISVLETLFNKKNCRIIWCDHHRTSLDTIAEHPEYEKIEGIRREGICGAALTWMYFNGCEFSDCPDFIQLISDFDCWQMTKDETLPFKYGIECHDYGALSLLWNRLVRDSATTHKGLLNELIDKGKIVDKYVKREYKQYLSESGYESEFEGYKCFVVNRRANSLIFGDLINQYPIMALWVYDGKVYSYSIYSNGKVDCSKLAELHGGGGHPGASGFTSEQLLLKSTNKGETS